MLADAYVTAHNADFPYQFCVHQKVLFTKYMHTCVVPQLTVTAVAGIACMHERLWHSTCIVASAKTNGI